MTKTRFIFGLICCLLLALIACQLDRPTPKTPPVRNEATAGENMHAVSLAYFNLHDTHPDTFWLEQDMNADPLGTAEKIEAWSTRVRAGLNKFSDTSTQSGLIAQNFRNFRATITILTPTGEASGFMARKAPDMSETAVQPFEISVAPKALWQKGRPFAFFDHTWPAVKVAALDFPELLQTALIFHELGHAQRQLVELNSGINTPLSSDAQMAEEVSLHELEASILDRGSNGQVNQLFDEILRRIASGEINTVLSSVVIADLQRFDAILGMEQSGPAAASISAAQFWLSLGFFCLDRDTNSANPETLLQTKVAFYRWISAR